MLSLVNAYTLVDFESRKPVTSKNFVFTGPGRPWEVVMDMDYIRQRVNADYFKKSPPFASKYLPFMPITDYSTFVSLGEGATPLIKSNSLGKELGIELYFKLDSHNPTGSFKDRGSAVEITIAKAINAKGITVASTGNMAASCSCYAAAAHIPCFVFVPEGTASSKLAQVIAYGGKIVQVKGSYSDAAKLAEEVASRLDFYLAGDYAFRTEGSKTAAFELADQFFFQLPDVVAVPMGCGTNIASYYKGFLEYRDIGFTGVIPQLLGVQAEGAPTIVRAFEQKLNQAIPVERAQSIAGAIAINDPLDGMKALDALYKSGGMVAALSDQEMLEMQYRLAKEEGLFVETSCAATVAGLFKLRASTSLSGKKVVCIMTGTGLKDPTPILKMAIKPPAIHPDVHEFLALYEKSFFEGKSVTFVAGDTVLFRKDPTKDQVKDQLQKLFGIAYSEEYVQRIHEIISRFLKKGKPVTSSDFQDIVQDALESGRTRAAKALDIKSFQVSTAKNKKAEARVQVILRGKEAAAKGEGVGPLDAIVQALRQACGETIPFSLSHYRADIRSEGADAVIYVELQLMLGNKSAAGTGASPDIIQASVEALEDAYNGLAS